jgi:hypothetical protein
MEYKRLADFKSNRRDPCLVSKQERAIPSFNTARLSFCFYQKIPFLLEILLIDDLFFEGIVPYESLASDSHLLNSVFLTFYNVFL